MLLLVAGRVHAAGPEAPVIAHGPRDAPRVALTFDLCPTQAPMELDDRIVDALVVRRAPATFFVSGRWAQARPDAVRRLAHEPLVELGNHSFRHPHLLKLDDAEVSREIAVTQHLLEELAGRAPHAFRPPFGEVDARVARIAAADGVATVTYDVISGDPGAGATKARVVHAVLAGARAGSIVVMHANHRRFATADAVPEIVDGLRARGFELVTVSELLGLRDAVEPAR
jgi:peptidoglycan/xylan/chitin deacetylase (PgdA/CDA1 family)